MWLWVCRWGDVECAGLVVPSSGGDRRTRRVGGGERWVEGERERACACRCWRKAGTSSLSGSLSSSVSAHALATVSD